MKANLFNDLVAVLRRLGGEKRGSVAIYFALAMFPILMMLGIAVDYGRALTAKSNLQAAVDGAIIVVVQNSGSAITQATRQSMAQAIVQSNLEHLGYTLTQNRDKWSVSESDPSGSKNYYEVTATGVLPTTFMSLLPAVFGAASSSSIPISAKAGARSGTAGSYGPGNGCVLSLDNSAVDDVWDNGNSQVTLSNCDIYDNSNNSAALAVGGSAWLTARKVNVTGGVSGTSRITAPAGIVTGAARTSDPYAWLTMPSYTGCDHTNYSTNKDDSISPGVYCGGISVNSSAVVTMSPGRYILDGGNFTVNGQATLTSSGGVTLVFTSSTGNNWPNTTINGGATVTLTAPTTAEIAAGNNGMNGILFYGDRNMPVGTAFKINGGSGQSLTGAIYVPEAAVNYAGTTGQNACIQLIGDTITFIGNSTISISGCSNYNLTTFGSPINQITNDVTMVE